VAAENHVLKMRYVQGVCEKEEQQGDNHARPGTAETTGPNGRRLEPGPKSAYAAVGQPEPIFLGPPLD
jgi:hypothetical protein